MSNEADRLWENVENDLRRKKGLCPLTPEEAQREFENLPDEEMTEDELGEIVDAVVSGVLTSWTPTPDLAELAEIDTAEVEEDALQLFRNPGDTDSETEDLIGRLRQEADEEDCDGEADKDGLDGDSQSPGESG
jgi:hypothetical protein